MVLPLSILWLVLCELLVNTYNFHPMRRGVYNDNLFNLAVLVNIVEHYIDFSPVKRNKIC